MHNYLALVNKVLQLGDERETRNGKVQGTFGEFLRWDLSEGFPILTTKEMKLHSVASELIWILRGSRSERELAELNETETTIWTRNADTYFGEFPGDVGNIYGPLLRNFHGVDQLRKIVDTLQINPTDRRMLVTMWDPSEHRQCLPTCHHAWQVYVREGQYLDLMWMQRSVDLGLGLPYDIAHYALLTHLLAKTVELQAGYLSCSLGDCHIYEQHKEALIGQLQRDPTRRPKLMMSGAGINVFNAQPRDFRLAGYNPHPRIKMEMIV